MGTLHPLSDLRLCVFLFCFLSVTFSQNLDSNMEKKDHFTEKLQELVMSNTKSEPGCNMYLAKMCFNQMANATMEAIIHGDDREDRCETAEKMSACIKRSLSDCPPDSDWPGMAALPRYITLLQTIKSTVCSKEFRLEREDVYEHCNVDVIGQCIVGFVYVASDASSVATCWQAKQTHTCLSTATMHCRSQQVQQLVSMVNAVLSQTVRQLCREPGCHVSMAKECLYMAKGILQSPLGSVKKSPVLCGAMDIMLSCVTSNTMNCGAGVYMEMGNYIMHVHEAKNHICQNVSMPMTMTEPYIGHIASFYTVAKSPFASKESVCPFYGSAVYKTLEMIKDGQHGNQDDQWYTMSLISHIARGICHDDRQCDEVERSMMMRPMCDQRMAMACVKYGDIWSLIANVDIVGWDSVCHETLQMVECIHRSLSGCQNSSLPKDVEKTVHQIVGTVASHCPIEPILMKLDCLQPKCQIHAALEQCFYMPNATTIANGETCMLVNKTMRCIHEKTSGCAMSPSLLPVQYAVKTYLDYVRPYCYTPVQKMKGDSLENVVQRCTFNFTDGFQNLLTTAKDYNSSMCHLINSVDPECNDMKDAPTVLLPGFKWQEFMWMDVMYRNCSRMGNNTEKIMVSNIREPESCDIYTSAGYLTNYWLRLMNAVFTPINEQRAVCQTKDWLGHSLLSLLVNCSPQREKVFMDAWMMIEKLHGHVCPVEMTDIHVMMPEMGSGDMMTKDDMCQPGMASQCMDQLEERLIMGSPYYTDEACKALRKGMECLHKTMEGCSHDAPELAAIRDRMPMIRSQMGNVCLDHFKGPQMCNMSSSLLANVLNQMECDKASASQCVDYFDAAKPMLEQNPKELCRAVYAAKMCVHARTVNCVDLDNISNGRNVTQVTDYLLTSCPHLMEMDKDDDDEEDNDDDMEEDEKECRLLKPWPVCSTLIEPCFNGSTDPTYICSNSGSIKACMSLAMVGCDNMTYASMMEFMKPQLQALPCDLLPAAPKYYVRPNMTFPFSCLANATVIAGFLNATDKISPDDMLCPAIPQSVMCLESKMKDLQPVPRKIVHKVAEAFKQQIFLRCNTTEKLLDNMDMLNDTATGFCSIDLVSQCIYGLSDGGTFGLASSFADRETKCSTRKDLLKCIQNTGMGCSDKVKARIMALLEWNDGIKMALGLCSEEMPKYCDIEGAMECVSQLASGHVLATGTEMEPAICAAISPIEKCVMEKTVMCSAKERLIMEQTMIQVTSNAKTSCSMDGKKDEEEERMMGECNVENVVKCAKQILNKTSTMLQGQGDKGEICREMDMLSKCIERNSVGCKGEEGMIIEAHKPLYQLLIQGSCSKELETKTKEGGYCMQIAGACLTQYLYVAMDSYTGMCSQAVPSLACLKTAVDMCPSPQKNVVAMATKHLATISMNSCGSKGCDPKKAYKCLEEADAFIKSAGPRILDSSMNCGSLMLTLVCAMNHTVQCKKENDQFLHMSIMSLHMFVNEMCPKMKVNPALGAGQNMTGVESLLPLSILLGSPSVTKDMICPQVKIAMMRYDETYMYMSIADRAKLYKNSYVVEKVIGTYCHDEKMLMMHNKTQTCNVSMVMECARKEDIPYKISASSLYGWDPVCMSVKKVLSCTQTMAGACTNYNDIYAALQLSDDLMANVKDHCPMEEMKEHLDTMCMLPPEPCNTHKALAECYVSVDNRDKVAGMCKNLTQIEMCFHRNLKGCMSIQMAPHANIIKSYRGLCGVSTDISDMVPNDEIHSLSSCFLDFMDDLKSSLRTTKAPYNAYCMASEQENKCIMGTGVMPPPMLMYLSMAADDMSKEFKGKFCNQTEDTRTTLLGEPYACMSEVAEMCVTSYFSRLIMWMVIPVGDRQMACGELLEVESCVANALKSCSPERQQMYKSLMEMVYFWHDKVCPTVPRRALLLSQETVCHKETAGICIQEFGRHLATQSGLNFAGTCMHFHRMIQCVALSTRDCPQNAEDMTAMATLTETAYSIMGNTCPLLSALVCNPQNWDLVFHKAVCNRTAAEHCMMNFSMSLPKTVDNDTAMCSMYHKSMECSLENIVFCEPDSLPFLKHTRQIAMATYGKHCSSVYGESAEMQCYRRKSCTFDVAECFPKTEDEVCRHKDEIEKCLMRQEEGCQENFKMERRGFILEHLKTHNITGCDIMSVMQTPITYPPQSLGQCFMMMQNLTGQFMAMDFPTEVDVCYGVNMYKECIKTEANKFDEMWKGLWLQTVDLMDDATRVYCKYHELLMKKRMEDDDSSEESSEEDSDESDEDDDDYDMSAEDIDEWMDDLVNMTMSKMNFTESEECQVKTAAMCMLSYFTWTTHVSFLPLVDRPKTCWYKKNTLLPCVANNTMRCSAGVKRKFYRLYEVSRRMEMSIGQCPDMDDRMGNMDGDMGNMRDEMGNMDDDDMGNMRDSMDNMDDDDDMGNMNNGMGNMRQGDSNIESMMSMMARAMGNMKGDMNMCQMEEAARCMGMLNGAIIGNAGLKSHTLICSSILPTYACVAKTTWGCKKQQIDTVNRVWSDLHSFAMATCMYGEHQEPMKMECGDMTMEMDMKMSCDMPQALTCFTSWQAKLRRSDEDICRSIPGLKSCMVKHLSGCEQTHREAVEKMFEGLHGRIAERCPRSECDLCGAARCMKMERDMSQDDDMTCFDGWKTKQCVMQHMEYCSEEEKRHMMDKMNERFANVSQVCKNKESVDLCALEFKDVTKKLLGLKFDLDWDMVQDDMDEDMDKKSNMTNMMGMDKDDDMSDKTMATNMTMENIMKHLLSNKSSCLRELMGEDKKALCKKAALTWRCVEMVVKGMPPNTRELAMGTMKLVHMAVEQKCNEEKLSCYSCRGMKSNEDCNRLPQQHCDRDNMMCYTAVENGRISKGCAPHIPYIQKQQCVDNGTKCVYLCDKDDCNAMPRKGIMDPPSCNRKMAVTCGIKMMHSLITSDKPNCGNLMLGLKCIHDHTKDCMSHADGEMFKMAVSLYSNPMMLKCQAMPQDCSCARCAIVTLGRTMLSPLTSMEEKCRMAAFTQREVVGYTLTNDCNMFDLKEAMGSVKMAKSLLGDTCDSELERMLPVLSTDTCDMDKAKMCMSFTEEVEWMIERKEKIGKHYICSMVYKMIGCVRHSTESCDQMYVSMHLNGTVHKALAMVSDMCNMTMIRELMTPSSKMNDEENMKVVANLEKAVGENLEMLMSRLDVIDEVMRTGIKSKMSICKPYLAMTFCHWDLMQTPASDANFCNIAKRAWDCQLIMTQECLPVQSVPVYHSFYTFIHKDANQCGFHSRHEQLEMWDEIPTTELAACVGDYINQLHLVYGAPNVNTSMTICKSAIELNECIYHHTNMPAFGKVPLRSMAEIGSEVMRVSCMDVHTDMSKVNCSKDDMLCHIMRNMTSRMTPMPQLPVNEPSTCRVDMAAFCVANYASRMIIAPFSPMREHEFTCRDLVRTKNCIEGNIATCSEPRKQMFSEAMAWMHNMTYPVCAMQVDMSEPSCAKVVQCVEKFGRYSMSMEYDGGEFCRNLDKTLDCIEQHAFNCSFVDIAYMKDTLYIMGNTTAEACPAHTGKICALTGMQPKHQTETCDEVSLGACISTYYEQTYGQDIPDDQYCSHLMTFTTCYIDNSKNCHPHTLRDYEEFLLPGLRSHKANCTDVYLYLQQNMPQCEVKHCKMWEVMHGMSEMKENITKMMENKRSLNEICSYVTGMLLENSAMIAGCNSLQLYLLNYVKNHMLDGYLAQCPGNTPVSTNDAVGPITKCYMNFDTVMGTALKTPTYGFIDICQALYQMHVCMDGAFSALPKNPAMEMASMQLNDTRNKVIGFMRTECGAAATNVSMLIPVKLPAEPAECKVDSAITCVKLYTFRTLSRSMLYEDREVICSEAKMMHKCVEENTAQCSSTLRWQVSTMARFNLQMIGDMCNVTMMEKSRNEKAREMYTSIVGVMTMRRDDEGDDEKEDDEMTGNRMNDDMEMVDDDDDDMTGDGMNGMNSMGREMAGNDMDDKAMEKCNLYQVNECLMSVVTNFFNMANKVCGKDNKYLAECVRPHIEGCDKTTKWLVHNSISGQTRTIIQKSCDAYMTWTEFIGEEGLKEDKDEQPMERRNAMDNRMMEMDREEMKMKRDEAIKSMLEPMSKLHQILQFVRSNKNPLDMENADSKDLIVMLQRIYKKSVNMTDCIEEDAYEGQGMCIPSAALECARQVDAEMMSPWTTESRVCVEYALAVRCGMMTSQGCDHMTSEHLYMRFSEVMGHVGDMCPTVVRDSCEMKTECKVKEVASCLMPLRSKIMATLQLPMASTGQLCGYLDLATECIKEKLEDCPEQVMFQMHEFLKPFIGTLSSMCHTLPAEACYTSLLWNIGQVLILDGNIRMTGSLHSYLDLAKKYNMTIKLEDMAANEKSVNVSDEYVRAITLIHNMMMMKKESECKLADMMENRDDDMETEQMNEMEGSLMDSLLHMVKYVMMNEKMVTMDEQFMKMARISMLNLQKDQSMQDLIDVTQNIVKEVHMRFNETDLKRMNITAVRIMNDVLKIIVGLGDGHEIVSSAYNTMAFMKIHKMMEKINKYIMEEDDMDERKDDMEEKENDMDEKEEDMDEKDDDMKEKEDDMDEQPKRMEDMDYLNMGMMRKMKKEIQKGLTEAALGLMKLHMHPDNMEGLESIMMMMKAKKLQTCTSLMDVVQCATKQMAMMPHDRRQLMNITIQSLTSVATSLCHNKKCYACDGAKSNMECNKQTPQMCDVAQSCYTLNDNDKIYKGCGYPVGKEFGNTMFCEGNMCNMMQYSVEKESSDKCNPMGALMCLSNLIPVMMKKGPLDQRLVYKNVYCIEQSAAHCSTSQNRMIGDLTPWLKHGIQESSCSGEEAEYECGSRSLVGLAMTVMNPGSPRYSVCSQLNDTIRLLEWSSHHNKCSEYEMMAAHKGIMSILKVVGPDYCPGVKAKRDLVCNKSMPMTKVCNKTAAMQCMVQHKAMDHYKDMMSREENDMFCWSMTQLLVCMENNTSGCDKSVDLSDLQMSFKQKVGFAVSHCPILESTLNICYPDYQKWDTVCKPLLVSTTCFDLAKDGCSILDDKAKMERTAQCIYNLTNGCSELQAMSAGYAVHYYMSEYFMSCGNNSVQSMLESKLATKDVKPMDLTIARLVAFVKSKSTGVKLDLTNDNTPIMELTHKLIETRINMTGVMKSPLNNMSSYVSMKGKEFFGKMMKMRSYIQDDTKGIARCVSQMDTQVTVAMTFPALFEPLYCESLQSFVMCVNELDLHLVPTVFASSMKDRVAKAMESVCYEYMDELAKVGVKVANVLGNKNMTRVDMMNVTQEKLTALLTQLQKEDDACDTFRIASVLAGLGTTALTAPFNNPETSSRMCQALHMAEDMLKPMVDKCSAENQEFYKGIVYAMIYDTAPTCYNPVMNMTVPDTCQADMATMCLSTVMSMLSSKATPDWLLCLHMSKAVQCVGFITQKCPVEQQAKQMEAFSYLQSIAGDRCPLMRALMDCGDYTNMGQVDCSFKEVKTCLASISSCSDIPATMMCVTQHSIGCSAFELNQIDGYMQMVWMDILNSCPEKDIINQLYSTGQCQRPSVCSLAEAYNCSQQFNNKDCSNVQQIQNCFDSNTQGCNDAQYILGRITLAQNFQTHYPTCVVPALPYPASAGNVTEVNRIMLCMVTFVTESYVAMNDSMSMKKGCTAFHKMLACLGKGVPEKEMEIGSLLSGSSFNVTIEILFRMCSGDKDQEMTEVAVVADDKCNRDIAHQCLSVIQLHAFFSSVMTQADKKAYCSKSMNLMVDCMTPLSNCMDGKDYAIRGVQELIKSINFLSGVCNEELWVCSPEDAVYCSAGAMEVMANLTSMMTVGNRTGDRAMMENYQRAVCNHFEEIMECTKRHTFGCSHEVNMAVRTGIETSLCLEYDIIKSCPSVNKFVSMDIPKCMDVMDKSGMDNDMDTTGMDRMDNNKDMDRGLTMDKNDGCSLDAVHTCVGMLYTELYTYTLECHRFHRTYVRTMQCIHDNSMNCGKVNPAAGHLIAAIANMTATSVWMKCPDVMLKPCHEPEYCGIEQAGACFYMFQQHYNKTDISAPEICLSAEVATYCSMEHTKKCSIFSKMYFPKMIKDHVHAKQVTCKDSAETCLHNYQMTTIGILHGDLTMAAILKKQQKMTFDIRNMMMMDETNMGYMMGNATKMMESAGDMALKAMGNFSDLSKFADQKTIQLLQDHTQMLGGLAMSDDHMAVYTKVKMVQCVALHGSWSCLMKTGDKAGLPMEAVKVLNATLGTMFNITSSMCNKASVLDLVEESESCQIMPAAMSAMKQINRLTNPVYGKEWFCESAALSNTIDQLNSYTVACSGGIRQMFDGLNSQMKIARDTFCGEKPVCNTTLVQACLDQYIAQQDCNTYETAHACVELRLMGCDQTIADEYRNELKSLSSQVSCEKFPTFKVTPSSLRLMEGGSPVALEISIEEDSSTWCTPGETCQIKFEIDIEDGSQTCSDGTRISQIVVSEQPAKCERTITSQDWAAPVSYTLTARTDGRYDGNKNIHVNVTAHKFVGQNKVLTRVISRMQAVVVDSDQNKICTSLGRSRLSSFDGLFQNVRYQGEFVIYKHKEYPQQVDAVYQTCSAGHSSLCICAVMVQFGDDSLTFDKCRRSGIPAPSVPAVTLYKNGELTPGFKVFAVEGRNEVKILLPTGTVVGIDSNLKLWIIPSTLDWLRTEGLCGVYDANKFNDATTKDGNIMELVQNAAPDSLASSWRVQPYESLFIGVLNPVQQVWNNYCVCSSESNSATCAPMMVAETCDIVAGTDITASLLSVIESQEAQRRRKRATSDPLAGLDVDYTTIAPEATWPSNWNATTARAYCENYLLQSDLGQKCITATGSDFESEVLACIYSIQENGDVSLTSTAMESLKTICVAEVEKNQANLDPALVSSILSQTCPNGCSGNGNCANSKCSCYANFEQTPVCSIPKGTQPNVFSIRDGDLCALTSTSSCSEVFIMGQNFLQSNSERTLTCHYEANGVATVAAAVFVTNSMVKCTGIPTTTSKQTWTITVTNKADRTGALGSLRFTVYHPSCYSCDNNHNCVTPNPATGCLVGSTCYESNAINPSNTCKRCIPELSTTDWTHVIGGSCLGYLSTQSPPTTNVPSGSTQAPSQNTGNETTKDEDQDRVILIVLGCLAGGFALISIFLACKVCSTKEKEINRQSDYSPSASDSASNKDYDNVHAFDNMGYSYAGTAQPSFKSQGASLQKQFPADSFPPPTQIVVDEEQSHL